jgi:hypothetical protein
MVLGLLLSHDGEFLSRPEGQRSQTHLMILSVHKGKSHAWRKAGFADFGKKAPRFL